MRCDVCQKEQAIIHIREVSEKGIKKINLCANCALQKGLNISIENMDFVLFNFLKNLFSGNNGNLNSKIGIKCPSCGTSIIQITEHSEVGCPICYSFFGNLIDMVIFKHNNSMNYLGKLPFEMKKIKDNKAKINDLKIKLRQYINKEEYKKAALVRDEIIDLKKSMVKPKEIRDE